MNEDPDIPEAPLSRGRKIALAFTVPLVLLFIFHYAVKTFRNNDPFELSERFIRGNALIQNEAGKIIRISSGLASRTRGGEVDMKRMVTGSQKKLSITVFMHCNTGSTDVGAGCTIQHATITDESQPGVTKEIPITWYDGFIIVYK